MPFRTTFDCLWCGDSWTARSPADLEGWSQLCPACLGRAGSNAFLRGRLRSALAERGASFVAAVPVPRTSAARPVAAPGNTAFPDDWFLRLGPFERGPIHDTAWAAELDVVTRWLDALPPAGRIAEPADARAAGRGHRRPTAPHRMVL